MRELDSIAVVGAGRLGTALAAALRAAGLSVAGPLGREPDVAGATLVLLCVPDGEIGAAAARVAPGPLVGHCSGATTLEPLSGHEALGLHPLMTVPAGSPPEVFRGAAAAVDGSTPRALGAAEELARLLGMRPMRVAPEDRAALAPLVRAAVETWAELGPERALTGPIARGDEGTVARQREAVLERTPELAPLFDALVEATRALARSGVAA